MKLHVLALGVELLKQSVRDLIFAHSLVADEQQGPFATHMAC